MSEICIRIVAADVPRETLKALLSQCRDGRKGKLQLTSLSPDGLYYYAVIENQATADTFMGALTRMNIGHAEIDASTVSIQAAPPKAATSEDPWAWMSGIGLNLDKPFGDWMNEMFPRRPGSSAS